MYACSSLVIELQWRVVIHVYIIMYYNITYTCTLLQGEMESDTEEDDLESGFEEMKSDEEEPEETQDPHSSKFRATGQLLLHYEEEPSFEGYLMFKGGKRQVGVH